MRGDSLRGLFGCHDLCCPGLGDGSRTFSRVASCLFGVACGRLAGLFFLTIRRGRLCGGLQGRSLAGCRQSVTFGAALLIIQRVERLLEVALADLVGSGHAVDHRRGVGVVLAIFDHLVGKAEQRVQPPHPAKRHLPQPVGQAILHECL